MRLLCKLLKHNYHRRAQIDQWGSKSWIPSQVCVRCGKSKKD